MRTLDDFGEPVLSTTHNYSQLVKSTIQKRGHDPLMRADTLTYSSGIMRQYWPTNNLRSARDYGNN